ncbi:MAG: SdrD B-like domain-containing protein [Gammaproteobacteria bacterium]
MNRSKTPIMVHYTCQYFWRKIDMYINSATKIFRYFVVSFLCTIFISPANAENILVTTADDSVLNDGQTSLREAFAIASSNGEEDVIILTAGVNYVLDFCADGPFTHAENFSLQLQGNNASIQNVCIDGTRTINNIGAGSLTVDSIEMSGVISNSIGFVDGAAIASEIGDIAILNSDIHGFEAGTGRVIHGGMGADFIITNTQIHDNIGTAIASSFGALNMDGSTIERNTRGVALVDGTPFNMSNSFVRDNEGPGVRTTGQGHSVMMINNTEITGNGGPGLSCSGCDQVEVTDSTISHNGLDPADTRGGGGVSVTWDIDDPLDSPEVLIKDTVIENNAATQHGGGVRVTILEASEPTATPGKLTIDNTRIGMNSTNGFFDIEGGGIYIETGNLVIKNNSILDDNRAGPLGGLTSSKGGAIYQRELATYTQPTGLTVSDSVISNNSANSQGGGIWIVLDGPVTISDSTVANNSANSISGGGMYVAGADVTVHRSTFSGNSASTGGGISLSTFSGFPEGSLTITESTISNNSASFGASGGGGIFVNAGNLGANVSLENSTVSGNSSANFGGGIMVMQTSSLTLNQTTITDNTGINGANLYVAAGDFRIEKSIITDAVGGDNCDFFSAPTISGGSSFVSDTSCHLGADDTIDAAVGVLGSLADNSGPTQTHLPPTDSPVAGLVDATDCVVTTDQRGVSRPQGLNCEPGSVEITDPLNGTGAMGDFVWADNNGNGVQDVSEPGFANIVVELQNCSGAFLDSTLTDANGEFRFSQLAAGFYQMQFFLPSDYVFSPEKAAMQFMKDSNVNVSTGLTPCYDLTQGWKRLGVDAGMVPTVDTIAISKAIYFTNTNRLWIRASSTALPAGSANLTAIIVINGIETEIGSVGWKAFKPAYQQLFRNIAQPDSMILRSGQGAMVTGAVEIR